MKQNQSIKSLLLCSTGCFTASSIATALVHQNSELYKNLKAQDGLLFNIGFNKIDVEKSATLMPDNLEFYQYKRGVTIVYLKIQPKDNL